MTIANIEMAQAWDGPEGDHWTEYADRYEAVGPEFWTALSNALAFAPGDDVLDIGCGTGRSTRDAARLVAPGRVVGVDLSGRMLERARDTARAENLTNVAFEQADAQVHPFEQGAFDVAMSTFGAMFFADPVAAFTNIAESLREGGRVGLLAWRELAANEWLSEVRSALAAGRELGTPPAGAPGPFGLADPDATQGILTSAGLIGVRVEPVDAPMRFGADAADAFGFISTLGITRGLLHDLDADAAEGALDALRRLLEAHEKPSGVELGGAAWLITAAR